MGIFSTVHWHGGNSLERIHLMRLLAILPVYLYALFTTGFRYLSARATLPDYPALGWRDRLADTLGLKLESGMVDYLLAGALHILPLLIPALLICAVWQRIFAVNRVQRFDFGFIYIAGLCVLMAHPATSLFHLLFALSFAMVFGYGVFGGEGKTIVSPALLAIVIMQVSFPSALVGDPLWPVLNGYAGTLEFAEYAALQAGGAETGMISIGHALFGSVAGLIGSNPLLPILIAAAVLIYAGLASVRLLAGVFVGVLIAGVYANLSAEGLAALPWHGHLLMGNLVFAAVFIATDPGSSASTQSGRVIQGLLIGALVVFLRLANPSHPDSVFQVVLLVSLLSPLIDHGVAWFNIQRRKKHGTG